MFQRAAASFDECNTAGIFLSGLRSQSFQSRLLFPSGIVPLPSSESPALPSTDPVTVAGLKGESQTLPCFPSLSQTFPCFSSRSQSFPDFPCPHPVPFPMPLFGARIPAGKLGIFEV